MAKARATKAARRAAAYTAMAISCAARPRWKTATVKLDFFFARKRRRDQQNMIAWTKAQIDGLQDAGIIADDSGLTFLPVDTHVDPETPRLQIVITRTRQVADSILAATGASL